MFLKKKKGLSPVIATTLLILMAVIIALIIFLWVKAFVGEKIQKDVGSGPEAIENFCTADQLQFSANAVLVNGNTLKIEVQNSGNIPIQGVEIAKKGFASTKIIGNASFSGGPLTSGDNSYVTIDANGATSGDVQIIAVLLGQLADGTKKEYACSKNYVDATITS